MENIEKLDKKELCNKLNINSNNLRVVEQRQQLKSRLKNIGYKLIDKIKEGRKVFYILQQEDKNKEVYNNMCEAIYKTKKANNFKEYILYRTITENTPTTKKEIANKASVGVKTIAKWDNIMLDKNLMSKDGYFYMCIVKNGIDDFTIKQVGKEEYNLFWKNKSNIKLYKDLQFKYINGSITLQEYTLAIDSIASLRTLIENKYYYRINKYIINKDNKLYIDTINLIKSIYGKKDYIYNIEEITE